MAEDAASLSGRIEERWQRWLLERNRQGTRTLLFIVAGLYPAFALVDLLSAPRAALPTLFTTRALVTLVTLLLFPFVRGPRFERWPNRVPAAYMLLCACGISLMTVFMGGMSSPYYAGLTLAIVATGLLFVWPPQVVITTHSLIVGSFILFNLIARRHVDQAAISNLAFLVSTALIAGIGQTLLFRTLRAQLAGRVALEDAKAGLERAATDLQAASRFKSQFFANVTHELRTPLAMILSPLELMLQGEAGQFTEAQRGTFSTMFKSGLKLLKMVGDLLDLSKLEESRLRLRVAEHDLLEQLRSLIAQTGELARRKNIEVTLVAPGERAIIFCDAERMERIFINLLSNAIKFTEPGGHIEVTVAEVVREGGERVLSVAVQDDGPGFPPDKAERLFERFYQVDMAGTRRHGGTGIGLALARELVELHGGSIRAESSPGKGARFTVELRFGREHLRAEVLDRRAQRRDVEEEHRETAPAMDWAVQLSHSDDYRLLDIAELTERRVVERDPDEEKRFHSVLVVEDTPDIVRLVHMTLRAQFKVFTAPDGFKGFELAQRELPSLIVTDLMMPGMSGLELTRKLREDPHTRHIPILMLTARGALDDRVAGLETGVNAYMTKPFSAKELLSTARQLVHATEVTADWLLTQRMDSLEIVAAGLAHEINNPLNYLKNAMKRARQDSTDLLGLLRGAAQKPLEAAEAARVARIEARLDDMFGIADSGARRIGATVELMRAYGRDGYSRMLRAHDVFAACADAVKLVVPAIGRKVHVETKFAGQGVVECVPEELNQVLTNLTQNAIEATRDDGSGVVRIEGHLEGDWLSLSVSDNGPGIKPEDRAKLFTPFFTTKEPGKGMGLGLTISYRVVQSLGGTLQASGALGEGATFTLRVPRAQPASAPPLPTPLRSAKVAAQPERSAS